MDLLSWLVEVWFLDRAFADAQERGELPWDEDFDPICVVAMAGRNGSFPLWLSAPVQTGIEKLHKRGARADAVPSHVIGRDGARAYRASLSANMSETVNTRSRTALRL